MLEVCIDSLESAIAAVEGGATRLELCSALSEGGLTPSPGILKVLKTDLRIGIQIFCMLRPRRGNDFCYSDAEMSAILEDMKILQSYGSDGFVFGALDESGGVNVKQCSAVIEAAGTLPVTFHRAFDITAKEKMHENCELIKTLGFKRILTSGFEGSAEDGLSCLRELAEQHRDIIIMPGAGINRGNLEKIIKATSCQEFHASARTTKVQNNCNTDISMGGTRNDAEPLLVTDTNLVKELVFIAKKI